MPGSFWPALSISRRVPVRSGGIEPRLLYAAEVAPAAIGYLRLQRLLPLAIAHWLTDGASVLVPCCSNRYPAKGCRVVFRNSLACNNILAIGRAVCATDATVRSRHEVREHRDVIVFDYAAEDPTFRDHHTPRISGLQSYISVPIVLPDGRFFGTLCAIDPFPHK